MTQFFTRSKKSVATNQGGDYSMGHTSYSGPSLMLASSQIRNGLLDSSTLTNSEFFYDLPRDQEDRESKRDRSGPKSVDPTNTDVTDDADFGQSVRMIAKSRTSHVSGIEKATNLRRVKKSDPTDDITNGRAQLLNSSPALEVKTRPGPFGWYRLSRDSALRTKERSKMTMRELMRRAQQAINIPRYLGALLSKNRSVLLPRDLPILVTDVDYFEQLGTFLSQTSYSDLQDYVTFSILHKYASYVDDEAASLKKKLLKPLAGQPFKLQSLIALDYRPQEKFERTNPFADHFLKSYSQFYFEKEKLNPLGLPTAATLRYLPWLIHSHRSLIDLVGAL
ncbi:unnamed protein product [Echinostoma caproni]|uniref:Peptidase_M13_N domain-containing protein n=1 Tax=Echinostoma caproni TaxID=27848 RepID=A0A183A5A7_9TREM|nr:unnamed protein product [Echinostoma caproni]